MHGNPQINLCGLREPFLYVHSQARRPWVAVPGRPGRNSQDIQSNGRFRPWRSLKREVVATPGTGV
jgi:hypothetical protein